MRILVLGGTLFLGRAVVEQARGAGHEVTLFNRGKTNPGLFSDLELLRGDRDGDLQPLEGRSFDAVVDTSAYFPRQVTAVADMLGDRISHYTFVSSGSVYADLDTPGLDETAELATVEDPTVETLGPNYGGFKALCEHALDAALPGRVHNVRAGLIVGPYDNTGRFTYWVERLAKGGEVLAPEPAGQPVQFIDVRDLAAWILEAAQAGTTGTFNAISAPGEYTLGTTLAGIQQALNADASLTWVDEDFLIQQGVEQWSELPLWLPSHPGFMTRKNQGAASRGLSIRPLSDTVTATHEWLDASDGPVTKKDFGVQPPSAGLASDREAELLAAWAAR